MLVHVHSDDLGGTEAASNAVLDVWEAGGLDSFSVLANGAALTLVGERLARSSGRPARISVHLNLVEGRSVSPPVAVPLLVSPEGDLRLGFGRLLRTWLWSSRKRRAELLRQVATEWRAQVEVVRSTVAPRAVAALDSHRHIHMLPFIFPVAVELAREEGIDGVRISREVTYLAALADLLRPFFWANVVKHVVLRVCASFARPAARRNAIAAPDAIVGVLYTGHMTKQRAEAGIRAAARASAREIEAVFHVGQAAAVQPEAPFSGPFYTSSLRAQEGREALLLAGTLGSAAPAP